MYKPPTWVNEAPFKKNIKDYYLEVQKNDEPIDRIDLCDKAYYTVGRNSEVCDIVSEHASLSRVHAAVIFHSGMKKFFVHDNNSVHGTFLGKSRLGREPKALIRDAKITFGASTRTYIFKKGDGHVTEAESREDSGPKKQLAANELPEDRVELDLLTEKNTQMNMKQAANTSALRANKRKLLEVNPKLKSRKRVNFQHSALLEEVINIYDVDDSVGKFKNLVNSTEIIDEKRLAKVNSHRRPKLSLGLLGSQLDEDDYEPPAKKVLPKENYPTHISSAPEIEEEGENQEQADQAKQKRLSLMEQLEQEAELEMMQDKIQMIQAAKLNAPQLPDL